MADSDSVEQNRRARQKRARLLKERRRNVAEAAENKSKKRVRKSAGSEGSTKKPKMDMHDAELFVDRIKVIHILVPTCVFRSITSITDCCTSAMQRRFAQSLDKYEKFLQILQVRDCAQHFLSSQHTRLHLLC